MSATAPFLRFFACASHSSSRRPSSPHAVATDVSWNDVLNFSVRRRDLRVEDSGVAGLEAYMEKVNLCNRNWDKQSEFVPFVVEGMVVGYVHNRFAEHLKKYEDVFTFPIDHLWESNFGYYLTLHPLLRAPSERTEAVGEVISSLSGELIPGIRNELYPVSSSFGAPAYLSLERAAAPYFGIRAYAIHMNGYVERGDEKLMWVAKRSHAKTTYPGKLDHLVAGGLPHGISCRENLVKECKEEAGIPLSISSRAVPVGALSYLDIDGYRLERDVLFCYDLKLPDDFTPTNEDGEVESFMLMPMSQVIDIIRSTQYFKPSCCLAIIDFLFRHGYIKPDEMDYLKLLKSLRKW